MVGSTGRVAVQSSLVVDSTGKVTVPSVGAEEGTPVGMVNWTLVSMVVVGRKVKTSPSELVMVKAPSWG